MTDDLRQRARAVFLELSTLEGPGLDDEIERRVGGDAALREAVLGLLADRAGADEAGVMDAPTAAVPSPITESAGTRIGPYKLLQRIGEGGFGSVFLAEQGEPVRRRVALKIIKLGMDTKQVIARFEAERQALALMDHPHIASVFDAGATDTGRPYFVMEYVVGDAITTFADAFKLDIRARLSLFTQVCTAVQHAHTKGVIHRDLKPANVLVSMVDGAPFAKVIDFGIAKATASPLTERTLFTEHGQLIGTPEYMSPEQAGGSPDIDTRTDVYALGVLLYELLTGETPFDAARLRSAAWMEMQRIIREEEPPAPSVRLSRDVDRIAETAAARQVEGAKLSASIKGELDWIVMKALDKERGRRYGSAAQFAEDVGNHLAGEAVVAAPVSAGYRVRKLVRRNKGAVVAGGAVVGSILLGLSGTSWFLHTAHRQNLELEDKSLELERQTQALTQQAASLENQAHIARDAIAEISRIVYSCEDCPPEQASTVGEVFVNTWLQFYGSYFSEESADERRLRAFAALAVGHAKDMVEARSEAEWSAYTANLALAQIAMDAGDWAGAREHLQRCPEINRGWEWRLLSTEVEAIVFHQQRSMFVALSPDGNRLVTNGYSNSPSIFDLTTPGALRPVERLGALDSLVTGAAFSLDGRQVAVRSAITSRTPIRNVQVWNCDPGEAPTLSRVIDTRSQGVLESAFDRSGTRLLTLARGGNLAIWDLSKEAPLARFGSPEWASGWAAWSPDDVVVASQGPEGTAIWATDSAGDPRLTLAREDCHATRRVFSPLTPAIITRSDDNAARVWSLASDSLGSELSVLRGHSDSIEFAEFSSDGSMIITCSADETARIWDGEPDDLGSPLAVLRGQFKTVAFNSDHSLLATGSLYGRVDIWNVDRASKFFGALVSSREFGGFIEFVQFTAPSEEIPELLLVDSGPHYEGGEPPSGLMALRVDHLVGVLSQTLPRRRLQLALDSFLGVGVIEAPELHAYSPTPARADDLVLTTPDGQRSIRVCSRGTVEVGDRASGRKIITLRASGSVIDGAFTEDGGQLVLLLHTEGYGVSAEIWDTRTPEQRKAGLLSWLSERRTADELIDQLWDSDVATDELSDAILDATLLSATRRYAAALVLDERVSNLYTEARLLLEDIAERHIEKSAVVAAANAAKLRWRVKAALIELAEAWEYEPEHSSDDELEAERRQRRLSEASLALSEILRSQTPPVHLDAESIAAVIDTRAELLGERHTQTAQARWLYGTLLSYQGHPNALDIRQRALDDMAADPTTEGRLLVGATYNLIQAELAYGTLAAAETRLAELIRYLEVQLELGSDEAIDFRSRSLGTPFHVGYGHERILWTPLPDNSNLRPEDRRERTVDWVARARALGLRGLLAKDGLQYLTLDVGTEDEPYPFVVPSNEAHDLIRLIPEEPEIQLVHALALLRKGEYKAAASKAAAFEERGRALGNLVLALPLAIRGVAAARMGDIDTATAVYEEIGTIRDIPREERHRRNAPVWNAVGFLENSNEDIEVYMRELADTMRGRPPR
ncbi:MAG: serine/threonine-protein kinase [Planctomycetota bacterium]